MTKVKCNLQFEFMHEFPLEYCKCRDEDGYCTLDEIELKGGFFTGDLYKCLNVNDTDYAETVNQYLKQITPVMQPTFETSEDGTVKLCKRYQ